MHGESLAVKSKSTLVSLRKYSQVVKKPDLNTLGYIPNGKLYVDITSSSS